MLRRFWKFYIDGKKKKIDELRTKFLVATIVFKFKIKCRKFGEQVGVRRKRDIRRTLTAILPPMQRVTKERAATLLKRFLFVADLNRSVKSGVIDTVNTIKTLQQKLRKRKTILQGRQEVLKQLVFEHYKTLCEHFIKKKDSKSTDLLKKLNQIRDIKREPIVNRVLELYSRRQVLYYTVRFLTWRVRVSGAQCTVQQLDTYADIIRARSEQLFQVDKLLFEMVDFPSIKAIYKKNTKKSPSKKAHKDSEKKTKKLDARAFLGSTFPGEESASFDKLERIQKLLIVDTTPELVASWGCHQFLLPQLPNMKPKTKSMLRTEK